MEKNKYRPYTEEFVEMLMRINRSDVQDNAPIGEESYLDLALQACKKFNEEFGDKQFDLGESQT